MRCAAPTAKKTRLSNTIVSIFGIHFVIALGRHCLSIYGRNLSGEFLSQNVEQHDRHVYTEATFKLSKHLPNAQGGFQLSEVRWLQGWNDAFNDAMLLDYEQYSLEVVVVASVRALVAVAAGTESVVRTVASRMCAWGRPKTAVKRPHPLKAGGRH